MNTVNSPRAIFWRATQRATSPVISSISRGVVSIVSRSCAIRIGASSALQTSGGVPLSRHRPAAYAAGEPGGVCRMKTATAVAMLLACLFGAAGARAETVDLLLVLAADVSRSIDETEFNLQRKGYAAAITDPRVLRAIAGGRNHAIAV